jgi:hypothetical protein
MEEVSSVLFPKARIYASSTKQIPVTRRLGEMQTSTRFAL